jgi:hypothetical protein
MTGNSMRRMAATFWMSEPRLSTGVMQTTAIAPMAAQMNTTLNSRWMLLQRLTSVTINTIAMLRSNPTMSRTAHILRTLIPKVRRPSDSRRFDHWKRRASRPACTGFAMALISAADSLGLPLCSWPPRWSALSPGGAGHGGRRACEIGIPPLPWATGPSWRNWPSAKQVSNGRAEPIRLLPSSGR